MAERARRGAGFLATTRGAWIALATAMAVSGAVILHTASGQTFDIDEIPYFGRIVDHAGQSVEHRQLSLEYLLAPFHGHLQLISKLTYEAVWALFGTDYTVFVLINVAALWASVGLTFELLRRRIGPLAALAPCVLLLFFGFASEVLLWPFDMVTLVSLAAGLGALLALERDDRRGDLLACGLLLLSIASVELGISFAIGAAVAVLWREDRLRRVWIFLLPIGLYAIWWLWARKFDQSEFEASNVWGLPKALLESAAAVAGALTGMTPEQASLYITPTSAFGRALAVAAIFAVLLRGFVGRLPRTFWIWVAVLISYWVFMAFAGRAPDGARYMFVGAVGFLLVGAEALAGRMTAFVTATICAVALIALPANVAQLVDERDRDSLHSDTRLSKPEYAMIELARNRVRADYLPAGDPRVAALGGALFSSLPAGTYLRSAARNGSLGFSLSELRRRPEEERLIADATLVGAAGIALRPGVPPRQTANCPGPRRSIELQPGGWLIGTGPDQTAVALRRFADQGEGVALQEIAPRSWAQLQLPADEASEPWRLLASAPVTVCPAQR